MKEITGGVCAAKGYKAAGIRCGIRKNQTKKDLALIISDQRAAAAAVYTCNLVKSAPIKVILDKIFEIKSEVGLPGRIPGIAPPFLRRLLAISTGLN